MKKVLFLIVIVVLVFGWLSVGLSFGGTEKAFRDNVALARKSSEEGLYEQSVEYYNAALAIKEDKELYREIKDAYKAFYLEQKNSYSYGRYINSLQTCCQLFEFDQSLWEELITQYYNSGNYSDAMGEIQKAEKRGTLSEPVQIIKTRISNMYEVNFKSITAYKTGRNQTYSVTDGNSYWVMRNNGDSVGIGYNFVGPLNENGVGIFTDNAGSTIRDVHQITRSLIDFQVEECGFFNSGLAPIQSKGKWRYLAENGKDSLIGEYEFASNMCNGTAAVKTGYGWEIIDTKGTDVIKDRYDDIVLDQYMCYTDGSFYIAAQNGVYSIYSPDGEQIKLLSTVEDIDIGNFSELFAYQDKETKLWGYMDKSGEIVISPTYSEAKGFSNGYAAVANDEEMWGIISDRGEIVTGYDFFDVGYFTQDRTCLVSRSEVSIGIFSFRY